MFSKVQFNINFIFIILNRLISVGEHSVMFEVDKVVQWTLQQQVPSLANPVKCGCKEVQGNKKGASTFLRPQFFWQSFYQWTFFRREHKHTKFPTWTYFQLGHISNMVLFLYIIYIVFLGPRVSQRAAAPCTPALGYCVVILLVFC